VRKHDASTRSRRDLPKPGQDEESSRPSCSAVKFGACSEPGDVLSPLQLVPRGLNDGRRVYIHGASFDDLAVRDGAAATLIYNALVSLPAMKLIHHDVVEEAVALGEFDADRAALIEGAIAERWASSISESLRCIGIRSRGEMPTRPLLSSSEKVVATCLDSNYYTFATSDPAARRMYDDVLALRRVRRLILEGGDAYRDLTMVRGRRLILLRPGTLQASPGDPTDVERIKRTALRDFENELRQIVEMALSKPTFSETRVLQAFLGKCLYAVQRTVLHLRP
jgi:hypothetical protein